MKLSSIPKRVLEAVKERGHNDEDIEGMSAETLFVEFCEWEGLINWGRTLYGLAMALEREEP